MADIAYTQNRLILLPDTRIREDRPDYVLVPLRGTSAYLAVFSIEDRCIGWIDTRDVGPGYETAKDWMKATNWIDGGY